MNKLRHEIERVQDKLKSNDANKRNIDAEYLSTIGLSEVKLRGYQLEGVQWLVDRYNAGIGCILADEMGLGKTCQTISFLVYTCGQARKKEMSLILAPLSVISNWESELTRFAPKLNFIKYIGNQEARDAYQSDVLNRSDIDIIITSYEIFMKDQDFLEQFTWHVLVVDEAHRLKNRQSVLHQSLLRFDIRQHVLLTGTPVQNNLFELFWLLCFIERPVFRDQYCDDFVECFKDVCESGTQQSDDLANILHLFLLRRIKADVLKDLPKKSEVVLYHGLSATQKHYYKAILNKDIGAFDANDGKPNRTRLSNVLMQLRKCVAHPYLFDGVEPEPFELGEHLVEASGKLTVIDKLLAYLHQTGHKVLLFSQMTRVLDIIQDYLGYRGYSYERLDGSVRAEERFLAVSKFNQDDETFVFLLSTKAGGQGLNLTAADTIIFVDSDFNPQNDSQAAARAHRIGQHRNVKVIRLVGRSTVEEIIVRRAEDKLRLTNAVIVPGQSTSKEASDSEEFKIEDIIKFGLDKLFENDESTMEDVDFASFLGPTVDSKWQSDVSSTSNKVQAGPSTLSDDGDNKGQVTSDIGSMYVFEGTDYSKEPSAADCKVIQQLLDEQQATLLQSGEKGRSMRNKQSFKLNESLFSELPTVARKPRKKLSPEELEQRRQKRAEAAALRAKQEEEQEVRRAQERKKKREAVWEANNYTSCSVESASDNESESTEDEDEEAGPSDGGRTKEEVSRIRYVVGDVTHPTNTGDNDAIVVHCVDNSGHWGKGGLFDSISTRSRQPEQQYRLAGKMKDITLGDLHLISIDDLQSRVKGKDFLGLIIAQSRDSNNVLSGIKLAALRRAFEKLCITAKAKKASVHLPRLGYKTPGFNWYGTERLIQQCLASRGVPTFVYYYPRKQVGKRKINADTDDDGNSCKAQRTNLPSTTSQSSDDKLADIFQGVKAYFKDVTDEALKKEASRYLIAYDGDIQNSVAADTTHVIVEDCNSISKVEVSQILATSPHVKIISIDWILTSARLKTKSNEETYIVHV